MKNKKGFTLIELLAVIVILAIIALIATPIVMNVIEKSKKGAAERSAENYISAVETKAATERVDGNILEGEYTIQSDGNLCPVLGCGLDDVKKLTIDMNGTKPDSGTIKIENGQVLDGAILEINDYVVNKVDGAVKVGEFGTIVDSVPNQTEAIKYDPVANAKCTTGDTCYNWYVLDGNETEYASVSLIMDRNLGNKVAWCNDANLCKVDGALNNSAGPITATNYLKEQTSSWEVEAKLPTYDQIYKASGNKTAGFPIWLYDYMDNTTNNVHGVYGYWTSTPDASYSHIAWGVRSVGNIYHSHVGADYFSGVRPVITVLKSKLSS